MKVTITIELGHIVNDNGTVDLKDSEDDTICREDTTKDCDLVLEELITNALGDVGLEPSTMETDWNG